MVIMIWFLYAILAAFFQSTTDAVCKKAVLRINEYFIAWVVRFLPLFFLIPYLFIKGIPQIKEHFYIALLVNGSLNVIANVLYIKAIKQSDLSITVPIISFTPLFLLFTSPLIMHEFPGLSGLTGVVLIVIGSYILNLKDRHTKRCQAPISFNGVPGTVLASLMPLMLLFKKGGPRLMLCVAFIWSITSNFDKLGVQNSSPLFWGISSYFFQSTVLFFILLLKKEKILLQMRKKFSIFLSIGLAAALGIFFHMLAIQLTLVVNVIAIKRTSALMSVFYGIFLFKEAGLKERVIGTIIMLLGVIFITVL